MGKLPAGESISRRALFDIAGRVGLGGTTLLTAMGYAEKVGGETNTDAEDARGPEIAGVTTFADGHRHTYTARLVGDCVIKGKTDVVAGHRHSIRTSPETLETRVANDHAHLLLPTIRVNKDTFQWGEDMELSGGPWNPTVFHAFARISGNGVVVPLIPLKISPTRLIALAPPLVDGETGQPIPAEVDLAVEGPVGVSNSVRVRILPPPPADLEAVKAGLVETVARTSEAIAQALNTFERLAPEAPDPLGNALELLDEARQAVRVRDALSRDMLGELSTYPGDAFSAAILVMLAGFVAQENAVIMQGLQDMQRRVGETVAKPGEWIEELRCYVTNTLITVICSFFVVMTIRTTVNVCGRLFGSIIGAIIGVLCVAIGILITVTWIRWTIKEIEEVTASHERRRRLAPC